jgi:hypothetical protein
MSNARSYQPALIADVVTNPSSPGIVALSTLAAEVLPDGCQVYCLSNRTLYRLNKTSIDSALGGAAGGIVAARGPGNWIPDSASQGSIAAQNVGDVAAAFSGVSNFTSIVGTFGSLLIGAMWEIDSSTGIVTWKGPSGQRFLVDVSVSMYNDTTVNVTYAGVSIDGSAVIPSGRVGKATSPVAVGADALYQINLVTQIELNQSQTVKILLAGGAGGDVVVTNMLYSLTPLN